MRAPAARLPVYRLRQPGWLVAGRVSLLALGMRYARGGRFQRSFGTLAATAAALLLGCASPARPGGMTPSPAGQLAQGPPRTVTIHTTGGVETFPLGRSRISNQAFTEALADALRESGLLLALADQTADYHLAVAIDELEQPHVAFPMTVRLTTTWQLRPRDEHQPLWHETLSTTYTEPFAEEFFGIKRLRLATEGAARQNIEQAVLRLSESLR
jgi:hypothetical protein